MCESIAETRQRRFNVKEEGPRCATESTGAISRRDWRVPEVVRVPATRRFLVRHPPGAVLQLKPPPAVEPLRRAPVALGCTTELGASCFRQVDVKQRPREGTLRLSTGDDPISYIQKRSRKNCGSLSLSLSLSERLARRDSAPHLWLMARIWAVHCARVVLATRRHVCRAQVCPAVAARPSLSGARRPLPVPIPVRRCEVAATGNKQA